MTQFSDAEGEYREIRPGSKGDYGLNWLPYIGADPIDTSTWGDPEPNDGGIVKEVSPAPANTSSTTSLWLSVPEGTTPGQEYHFKNTITTVGGRTRARVLRIKVVAFIREEPAYSYTELQALRKAYAQGVTRVRYGIGSDQKEVEYRSLADMKTLIDQLTAEISGTATTVRPSCSLASHRRG